MTVRYFVQQTPGLDLEYELKVWFVTPSDKDLIVLIPISQILLLWHKTVKGDFHWNEQILPNINFPKNIFFPVPSPEIVERNVYGQSCFWMCINHLELFSGGEMLMLIIDMGTTVPMFSFNHCRQSNLMVSSLCIFLIVRAHNSKYIRQKT